MSSAGQVDLEVRNSVRLMAAASVLMFAICSVEHFRVSWRFPEYQFFPILGIAIATIGYCRNVRPAHFLSFISRPTLRYGSIATAGFLLLCLSQLLNSSRLAFISFLIFSLGFVLHSKKFFGLRLLGPWLLGWILVRPPKRLAVSLTQELQLISSGITSQLLDFVGINHLMMGNVIQFPKRELFVDSACSGIVSLFSIVSFGAILSVARFYSLTRTAALLTVGLISAVILNIARIFIIAFTDQKYGINLADGIPHEILGIVLFGLCLGGFFLSDRIISLISKPIPIGGDRNTFAEVWNKLHERSNGQPSRRSENLSSAENSLASNWLFTSSFLLALAAVSLSIVLVKTRNFAETDSVKAASAIAENFTDKNGFGSTRYELTVRDLYSPLGAFSKSFSWEDTDATFSLDYPFMGYWHELQGCYRGSGWKIEEREVINAGDTGKWPIVVLRMEGTSGEKAQVLFSLCDISGRPCSPPKTNGLLDELVESAKVRFFKGFAGESIQFQYFQVFESTPDVNSTLSQIEKFTALRDAAFQELFDNAKN